MFSEKDTSDMMSDTGITSSAPQLVQIAVTGLMDTQPMDHLESGSEQEGTGLPGFVEIGKINHPTPVEK